MISSRSLQLSLAAGLLMLFSGVNMHAGAMNTKKHKKSVHHHHASRKRHVTRSGSSVERRSNGRVSDVHNERRHMDIHHGLNGERRVSVTRADHSRIVSERGRAGFAERPYAYHGNDFYHRTYYYHGHAYERYYRGYAFRGVGLHVYVPYRYYPVGFYGWAYHPWRTHVVYAWGWGARPWYGYYGYYFQPYPSYPSASAWLTDRMIANDLQASYDAGVAAGMATGAPPVAGGAGAQPLLGQDVKDLVAAEVEDQLNLENTVAALVSDDDASNPAAVGIARTFADGKPHVFVVGGNVEAVDEDTEADCGLSDGDVVRLDEAPEATENTASVEVLASKSSSECGKGSTVTVSLNDLQEMQNHMRESIDDGLAELQQKQGTGGLPAAPAAATAEVKTAAFAPLAPPPDPNDAAAIEQQQKDADQSEQEVTAEEKSESPAAPEPPAQQPAAPIVRPAPR